MALTINDYKNYLLTNSIFIPKLKIELLRYGDETVYDTIYTDLLNTSGSINVQRNNGLRRTADFTLMNINANNVPTFEKLPPRQKFQISLGVEINDEILYISQGIFVLENPSVISNFSESTVNIKCLDKFALATSELGQNLNYTYIIPVGTNIFTAIKDILILLGDPKQPILQSEFKNEVTPYTITKEAGSNLGEILIELAYLLSANIYYNTDGELVFEKDYNDDSKGSEWDFTTEHFVYQGSTHNYKYTELYNAVLVVGSNANNGEIYSYEAVNTNLLSSSSVNNLGYQRTYYHEDPNIYSDLMAQELAEYILKRLISVQSEVAINSMPLFFMDVDQIVTLTDANLALNKERVLVNGFTQPLQIGGQMSLSVVKAVDLPYGDV